MLKKQTLQSKQQKDQMPKIPKKEKKFQKTKFIYNLTEKKEVSVSRRQYSSHKKGKSDIFTT